MIEETKRTLGEPSVIVLLLVLAFCAGVLTPFLLAVQWAEPMSVLTEVEDPDTLPKASDSIPPPVSGRPAGGACELLERIMCYRHSGPEARVMAADAWLEHCAGER